MVELQQSPEAFAAAHRTSLAGFLLWKQEEVVLALMIPDDESHGAPVGVRCQLRTSALSRGDYIWGRHNLMGQDAGLIKQEISRITACPDAAGWSDFDAALRSGQARQV